MALRPPFAKNLNAVAENCVANAIPCHNHCNIIYNALQAELNDKGEGGENNLREIMLNGYIDDEVWFGDEITPDALHNLLYDEEKDHTEDVHIRLNSYGGSCNAAVRMHDDMVAYPGKVHITVSGTAASAATVLCMAADRLEMTPGSLWMIHDPSIIAMGNVRDLKDAIHLLEACKDSILNVYSSRIKITREQAGNLMSRTTWMDAQKALEDGFIDSILTVKQAGPTDCIVSLADAEQRVMAWMDRQKMKVTAHTVHNPVKEGILYEARKRPEDSTAQRADTFATTKAQEGENEDAAMVPEDTAQESPPEAATSIAQGTPVSQLQKRLALIMPSEAKNAKERQYE